MRCEEVVIWLELTENIVEIGIDGLGEGDGRRGGEMGRINRKHR